MLRICGLFLLLTVVDCKVFAGIDVELVVFFKDTAVQCQYFYVLDTYEKGKSSTLAVFDTLSFNGNDRVSLFYTAKNGGINTVLMVDTAGVLMKSKPFRVSSGRLLNTGSTSAVFNVVIGQGQISVALRNHHYLQKNRNNYSYFIFLFTSFTVKFLIAFILILLSNLPKRIITVASGAFLLSIFIDLLFPFHYIYRFIMTLLAGYILIAIVLRKSISWLQTTMLVLIVNIAGFGIIAFMYIFYVLW